MVLNIYLSVLKVYTPSFIRNITQHQQNQSCTKSGATSEPSMHGASSRTHFSAFYKLFLGAHNQLARTFTSFYLTMHCDTALVGRQDHGGQQQRTAQTMRRTLKLVFATRTTTPACESTGNFLKLFAVCATTNRLDPSRACFLRSPPGLRVKCVTDVQSTCQGRLNIRTWKHGTPSWRGSGSTLERHGPIWFW